MKKVFYVLCAGALVYILYLIFGLKHQILNKLEIDVFKLRSEEENLMNRIEETITTRTSQNNVTDEPEENSGSSEEDGTTKYILQWTSGTKSPFYHMKQGDVVFKRFNCKYQNCFVTDKKNYFDNLTVFDAIVFNGNDVIFMKESELPQQRSPKQKYVFGATESAHNNRACNTVLNNFFNWTWTYRLDSDFRWGYITVYDLDDNPIGPKTDMHWPDELKPIGDDIKEKLKNKSKAAAWFVSHCKTKSHREDFVKKVQKELEKYKWSVDVYGGCGKFVCPRNVANKCYGLVEKDYYFYFSFENSFAEDYVTEKLLTALNHYAVPVVFGGANYSRFLPPGSYLNARELGAEKLADTMNDIINNSTRYQDFFRWRNHYKYAETTPTTDLCNLCNALNDKKKVAAHSTYEKFREWWNDDQWKGKC